VSNDGGFANARTFPVAGSLSWTLDSSGPGRLPKTVYVRFDNSTQTFQDDIILDEGPPHLQSATIEALGSGLSSAAVARLRKYAIHVRAKDKLSGIVRVEVTRSRKRAGRVFNVKRSKKLRKRVTFRSPNARVFVRAEDAGGNWSAWRRARRIGG
jgi:hypothetical protein